MPKRLPFSSRLITSVILFCLLVLFSFQSNASAAKYQVPPNHQLNNFEKEVIRLVNQERAKRNLKPLQTDTDLSYTARVKSADMRDNDYFSHDSPQYGSPTQMVDDFGIQYNYGVGENIAAGQKTPAQVMIEWMNSDGHRRNILDPEYTHIGVGYVDGGEGQYDTYWTQQFVGR